VVTFLTPVEMKEDAILEPNLQVKKGDQITVHIGSMHKNPDQWQKAEEFIPERFDPESEYYLTPKGKKRDPISYMPFSVGRRICFGKAFAEVMVRTTSVMLCEAFDFTFDDPDFMNYTPAMGIAQVPDFKCFYHIKMKK